MPEIKAAVRDEPYLLVNIIFTGVILAVLIYSGIFSPEKDNYPVVCYHEKITGMPCASCGLSHSFSFIVRGKLNEAYQANIYGMRIFLFFASQLVLRSVFSIVYYNNRLIRKQVIIYDVMASVILFIVAFYPFLRQLIAFAGFH